MRLTDGFRLLRDGVRVSYATEVRDLHVSDDHFTAYAAVRRVEHRGHTLNPPLLTVECFSPAEGVIGVRTTHHAGKAQVAAAVLYLPRPGRGARVPSRADQRAAHRPPRPGRALGAHVPGRRRAAADRRRGGERWRRCRARSGGGAAGPREGHGPAVPVAGGRRRLGTGHR